MLLALASGTTAVHDLIQRGEFFSLVGLDASSASQDEISQGDQVDTAASVAPNN
jgi:hypothetical protein